MAILPKRLSYGAFTIGAGKRTYDQLVMAFAPSRWVEVIRIDG